jgi:hypothetical protein
MKVLEQLLYQYTEFQQEEMEEKFQSSGENSAPRTIQKVQPIQNKNIPLVTLELEKEQQRSFYSTFLRTLRKVPGTGLIFGREKLSSITIQQQYFSW